MGDEKAAVENIITFPDICTVLSDTILKVFFNSNRVLITYKTISSFLSVLKPLLVSVFHEGTPFKRMCCRNRGGGSGWTRHPLCTPALESVA